MLFREAAATALAAARLPLTEVEVAAADRGELLAAVVDLLEAARLICGAALRLEGAVGDGLAERAVYACSKLEAGIQEAVKDEG